MSFAEFEEMALSLPERDRLRLIELLWNSLEPSDSRQRSQEWAEEAERRVDAVDSGLLPTIGADEVFRELRAIKGR